MKPIRGDRRLSGMVLGIFVALAVAGVASAHAELETSTPADGAIVPSPFGGPIVLTFSAALADGSKASLLSFGESNASATVDGVGGTMTITLDVFLVPGEYEVRWVSVADDGDLLRGTVSFTVAPAPPTPEPTPSPAPTPVPSASVAPATPSPEPTPSASPEPSPTPPDTVGTSGAGDVLIPIVVALLVVAVGAAYLLSRRGRPAP